MTKTIICAFCNGTGTDPFGLLSSISKCQVCKGSKGIDIKEPFTPCVYCSGSGENILGARVPCIVCGGKGNNHFHNKTECSQCKGTGKGSDHLPCTLCGGIGLK
jgi:DnaJ-class molecular chaperone